MRECDRKRFGSMSHGLRRCYMLENMIFFVAKYSENCMSLSVVECMRKRYSQSGDGKRDWDVLLVPKSTKVIYNKLNYKLNTGGQ